MLLPIQKFTTTQVIPPTIVAPAVNPAVPGAEQLFSYHNDKNENDASLLINHARGGGRNSDRNSGRSSSRSSGGFGTRNGFKTADNSRQTEAKQVTTSFSFD
jgi:hypothetical protein